MAACRKGTNNKYEFKFDRVFSPTSSQAEVFEEISQLVQVTVTDAHFAVVSWLYMSLCNFVSTIDECIWVNIYLPAALEIEKRFCMDLGLLQESSSTVDTLSRH